MLSSWPFNLDIANWPRIVHRVNCMLSWRPIGYEINIDHVVVGVVSGQLVT